MGVIHALLSGKGGAGKSYFASVLAQYLESVGQSPACFDIDPVNSTLSGYKALDVRRLDVMRDDDIDHAKFDVLVEELCDVARACPAILDSGASTYVPLCSYLNRYRVPKMFEDDGHRLVLHAVVIGGQSQDESVRGLVSMLGTENLGHVPVVAWLNPYFGPINQDGMRFEQMRVYTVNRARYAGVVHVPGMDPLTTNDVQSMLEENLTFHEALENGGRIMMVRQRLRLARTGLFRALDAARVAESGVLYDEAAAGE